MVNPFQPPDADSLSSDSASHSVQTLFGSLITVAAPVLWATLTLKLLVAGPILRNLFEEFDFSTGLVTRALLHPMAALTCASVTLMLTVNHFSSRSPHARRQTAQLGLVIGLAIFCSIIAALIWPLTRMIYEIELSGVTIQTVE